MIDLLITAIENDILILICAPILFIGCVFSAYAREEERRKWWEKAGEEEQTLLDSGSRTE